MNEPEKYRKNNYIQEKANLQVVSKYLSLETWKEGESILEIGVGDGKFTMEIILPRLQKKIGRYVLSDISEKMIEFARKKYNGHNNWQIEFILLDGQTDNLPADLIGQFDRVVSFFTFHWFTNVRQAVENLFRLLKPGGQVIATFLEKNTLDDVFFNLSENSQWRSFGHENYISNYFFSSSPRREWKRDFSEAGFVNIEMFSEDRCHIFPDEEKLEEFTNALNPVILKIPIGDREAYLADYLREVKRSRAIRAERDEKTGEEKFFMEYTLLIFKASKPLSV